MFRYAVQHLIFEQGCYTAATSSADGWHFSNGTYIPASKSAPEVSSLYWHIFLQPEKRKLHEHYLDLATFVLADTDEAGSKLAAGLSLLAVR